MTARISRHAFKLFRKQPATTALPRGPCTASLQNHVQPHNKTNTATNPYPMFMPHHDINTGTVFASLGITVGLAA